MPDAATTESATLRYRSLQGKRMLLVEEIEPLLHAVEASKGILVVDEDGHLVGTFTPAPLWDDATGTPEEDAEDIRLAMLAMEDIRLNGSISLQEFMLEDELGA